MSDCDKCALGKTTTKGRIWCNHWEARRKPDDGCQLWKEKEA